MLAVKVSLIVDIYDGHDFMASLQRYLLNHAPHLPISYECYFHGLNSKNSYKINVKHSNSKIYLLFLSNSCML